VLRPVMTQSKRACGEAFASASPMRRAGWIRLGFRADPDAARIGGVVTRSWRSSGPSVFKLFGGGRCVN